MGAVGGLWRNRRGIAKAIRTARSTYDTVKPYIGGRTRAARLAGSSSLRGGAKKSIRTGLVMNEGTGGQYSMFSHGSGKGYLPTSVESTLPPQAIQANLAMQLKSPIGEQNIVDAMQIFGPSLATVYTGDKISRVIYQKASGDLTLNNIYLSNAYVIIYDIFARRDSASGSISTPSLSWSQGDVDESATGAYKKLGSTPWQSECFNQFWEVKQVTNVVLAAGATHVHKVRLNLNKVVSAARAQYNNGMLGGITYWCLIEVHGSPANDTVTQTQVTVGAGGLNIIADQEQVLRQLNKSTPTITTTNTLLTAFSNAEQVVNLGGSTIQTNAEG